ncbi:MAG TPA: Crp/Fnr family transcriptional regulator [Thermomicrobiales bacterium]|nr:Crp/Fnr family transcriptional regulator [Thermomicrobiales bacterium]
MSSQRAATIDHLSRIPLFAELPDGMLSILAGESRVRRFPDGQVLFSEGDPGDTLLILEEGRVKVSRYTASGQEVVLAIIEAPSAFGELSLIDGAPRSASVTAQAAITVRILPRMSLMGLVHSEPSVAMALMTCLVEMVRDTNDRLSDVLSLDVPGRVAKWLLAAGERSGQPRPGGVAVPFTISQSELAGELGTTRVSINKALKSFESLGLIHLDHEAGRILIIERDELGAYAG